MVLFRRFYKMAVFPLWIGGLVSLASLAYAGEGLPEIRLELGGRIYTLEHATTPQQTAQGLMFRERLEDSHGMLFSFATPAPVSFWMKNTLIPLDILFLRNGKIIHIERSAPPCPPEQSEHCPIYGPQAAVDQVIELPAGTVDRHRIRVGLSASRVEERRSSLLRSGERRAHPISVTPQQERSSR